MDNHEVLGLLKRWRPPNEKGRRELPRGDNNPPRTRASAHTVDWLDVEELHQLCPVGIAALREQRYAQWPEEGTGIMELFEWRSTRREREEN